MAIESMPLRTTGKLVLIMLLWALCFPLITVGIKFAPHLTFATLRAALAGGLLLVLAMASGQRLPSTLNHWVLLGVVGLGATTFGFLGMFHAAEFVSPGIATVVANTQPLLAAVLGVAILSERINLVSGLGLGLGFLGTLLIAVPRFLDPSGETYLIGLSYIVLAATGIAVSNVVIKQLAGEIQGLMAMGLQLLLGSVPLGIAAYWLEAPLSVEWSTAFIAVLLGLAVLGTALVYWLWMSVLVSVPLTRANAFSFLVSVFGVTIGALFYSESFSAVQLFGMALTLIGVWVVSQARLRNTAIVEPVGS